MNWKKDCHPNKLLVFCYACLFFLTSCHDKQTMKIPLDQILTTENQELLLGKWYPADTVPLNMNGYCFMADNLCKNYLGFYEYADPVNAPILSRPETWTNDSGRAFGYGWIDNIIRCYGQQTVYEIYNDQLRIFDPSQKDWIIKRIEFNTADTLILHSINDTIQEIYTRKTDSPIDKISPIDEILCYYPQTFSSDEMCFSIKHTDSFYSTGYKNGRFRKDVMPEGIYEQLVYGFKLADQIMPLAELCYTTNQDRNSMDHRIPHISFIKDKKISTLKNPIRQVSPLNREFYWSLFSILFLPDYIHFVPSYQVDPDGMYISSGIWLGYNHLKFLREDSTLIKLFPTEELYLCNLLIGAKPAIQHDPLQYQLKGIVDFFTKEEKSESIKTDGRYFRYYSEYRDDTITIDIGFNFIENNGLNK